MPTNQEVEPGSETGIEPETVADDCGTINLPTLRDGADDLFEDLLPEKRHRPQKPESSMQTACKSTWEAYRTAYGNRYGVLPIRNAKVNGQVKAFVQRIPADEAPDVAAFYVRHPDVYYVRKMHDFGSLLADAEKLRTEWATGRHMTTTKARQADRAGNTMDALEELLREQGGSI